LISVFNEFLKDPSELKLFMSSGSLLNITDPEQSLENSSAKLPGDKD